MERADAAISWGYRLKVFILNNKLFIIMHESLTTMQNVLIISVNVNMYKSFGLT